MRNIKVFVICLLSFSVLFSGFYVSETFALDDEETPTVLVSPQSDEEIQTLILQGTPEDLQERLKSKFALNNIYLCNTPLSVAIRSMAFSSDFLGINAPDYAIKKVELLIDAGADVNQLRTCSDNAQLPLIQVLALPLEMNAMVEIANQAVDYALESGEEMCELPTMNPQPCKNITTEDVREVKRNIREAFAAEQKRIVPYMMNMIELLVKHGADINKQDVRKTTALHHAAEIPQDITLKPLKYLIENGANINAQDINGNTPLFIAYAVNNPEAVKLLLNAGADITIRNNNGLLYNEVTGHRKRVYVDKDGNIRKDTEFGARHNL